MFSKARTTLLAHFPCSLLVELEPNKNAFIQIKKPTFDYEKSKAVRRLKIPLAHGFLLMFELEGIKSILR